mgnify:CR=1 FL=1
MQIARRIGTQAKSLTPELERLVAMKGDKGKGRDSSNRRSSSVRLHNVIHNSAGRRLGHQPVNHFATFRSCQTMISSFVVVGQLVVFQS